MAERSSGAGSGRSLLRPMALAIDGVVRLPRRHGGDGALAMAGGDSIGAGIRGCSTLHLGLRVDGTRNPRAFRSTSAISSGGLLPLRASPDVRGLRGWLDRAVGRFGTCPPLMACASVA